MSELGKYMYNKYHDDEDDTDETNIEEVLNLEIKYTETMKKEIENLIDEINNKSIKLFYILADDKMNKCGHSGTKGLGGNDSSPWDGTKATLESTLETLKICLERYEVLVTSVPKD